MKLKISKCEKVFGCISISGSKNVALPVIASSLLSKKTVILKNIPLITDVLLMLEIIKTMGVFVKREKDKVKIKAKNFNPIINSKDVSKFRGSYYLIGACLARYNMCSIRMPGGCSFTDRPIDLHLKAFKKLGYVVSKHKETIVIKKEKKTCTEIVFEKKSLGATINTIVASSLINRQITIQNISQEPEVLETISFLKKLGISISLIDNKVIINGIKKNKTISFKIISDRIEAGSYMLLASAVPNSELRVRNAPIQYMANVIEVLQDIGCNILKNKKELIVKSANLKAINLEVNEYPSFPTDLQQILSVVLLKAKGKSQIKDNVYPDRLTHVKELRKMKAKILDTPDGVNIRPSNLVGSNVEAKDLRCCFALIVAGSIACKDTIISNAEILLRGYEKPLLKLKSIGIKVNEYIY